MRYVDTHCHLDHHGGETPADQVARARESGVALMVTIGTDVASSQQSVATAAQFDDVLAAVGIHPNDAGDASDDAIAAIDALATAPKVVAIGETGLDFYRDWADPADQERAFRDQIAIAKQHDRALVIHCRDAWPDTIRVLLDAGAPDRTIMHCFSGDVDVVRTCAEHGWWMSFAGNMTFKNAQDLRDAAAAAPADLLLTETDSPYLTPVPHRGKANEPHYVSHTMTALAALRGADPAELAETILANARRAFALGEDLRPTGA